MLEVFLTLKPGHVRWEIAGARNRSGSDPIDTANSKFNEIVAFGLSNAMGPHRGITSMMVHIEDDR